MSNGFFVIRSPINPHTFPQRVCGEGVGIKKARSLVTRYRIFLISALVVILFFASLSVSVSADESQSFTYAKTYMDILEYYGTTALHQLSKEEFEALHRCLMGRGFVLGFYNSKSSSNRATCFVKDPYAHYLDPSSYGMHVRETENGTGSDFFFHPITSRAVYMRINTFTKRNLVQDDALPFLEAYPRALYTVLDLSGNLGGLLITAREFVEIFSPGPGMLMLESRGRDKSTSYMTYDRGIRNARKTVVIVDRNSASASEIVTGVLKGWGAEVISTDPATHGKGSVQAVKLVSDGGALVFTVAQYYFADGTTPEGRGIAPTITAKKDALTTALEYLGISPDDRKKLFSVLMR